MARPAGTAADSGPMPRKECREKIPVGQRSRVCHRIAERDIVFNCRSVCDLGNGDRRAAKGAASVAVRGGGPGPVGDGSGRVDGCPVVLSKTAAKVYPGHVSAGLSL